ncbi:ECF transporter S component [Anaerovorax odorimutans]|uniref:ECF transporter S component n=1 Tax=Anaerovorax odorimutans TaxID=109327 RepID=UPI00040E368E|nr:ECF transporter S component [Anaerovorax odorimutans]
MSFWQSNLNRFNIFDLIVIAMLSSLGIAIKPIIAPLSHILIGPLPIPPGAVTGGIYMLWLVLGFGITKKRGTMTLMGLVQGILVMSVGLFGSQGALSIITYTMPGLVADIVMLLIGHRACCMMCSFTAGMTCNVVGTLMVNLTNYRFPLFPLLLSLGLAALSGGIGGIIAYKIIEQISKLKEQGWEMNEE